jgi:hypothetical protein
MELIKSICPGVVIIADANLRLTPGEQLTVDSLTPDMQKALSLSLLAKIDNDSANETTLSTTDLSRLNVNEAITHIHAESDPVKIKMLMETEKRRSVLDAMKVRLAEVQNADK